MRKTIIMGTAVALSLAFAATASADSNTTTFEGFHLGSVNTQDEWTSAAVGDLPGGAVYDQNIVEHDGGKALRISNSYVNGEFDHQTYSKPTKKKAGESGDVNTIANEFSFQSAAPQEYQRGLAVSVSPTDPKGARMSYVRLEDGPDGIRVFFDDTPNTDTATSFTDRWITTLDRGPHTIKFVTTFVAGNNNDIVRLYIDGEQKVCGTSWENYYRFGERNPVTPSDRLMWRLSTPVPAGAPSLLGKGFLFDDVTSSTYQDDNPVACPLPVGPAGEKGNDGAPGGIVLGAGPAGQSTIVKQAQAVQTSPMVIGNTKRTVHAPLRKGEKFISARATLRGKRLPVHRRSVTVDLRGGNVGNYNVYVSAKYRTKSGKLHAVRFMRALSIARAPLDTSL